MEVNLKNLSEEVKGLEHFIEKASSEIENVLERFNRVEAMVRQLQRQEELTKENE